MYHSIRITPEAVYSPLSDATITTLQSKKNTFELEPADTDTLKGISNADFVFAYNGLRRAHGNTEHEIVAAVRDYSDQAWNMRGERIMSQTEYLEWRSGCSAEEILAAIATEAAHTEEVTDSTYLNEDQLATAA